MELWGATKPKILKVNKSFGAQRHEKKQKSLRKTNSFDLRGFKKSKILKENQYRGASELEKKQKYLILAAFELVREGFT